MTALSDALAQAQRAALAALAKRYIAGKENETNARILLDSFGGTDELEQEYLLSCWAYLREAGVQAPVPEPQSYSARRASEPATDAQWNRIRKDCKDRDVPPPDSPLTKESASKVIEALAAGTYNAQEWALPDALRA